MGWAFWENSKWNSDMEDMAETTKPSEVRKLQTGGCICDFSYWAAKQPSTQPTPRDSKSLRLRPTQAFLVLLILPLGVDILYKLVEGLRMFSDPILCHKT